MRPSRAHKLRSSIDLKDEIGNASDAEIAVESLLNLSGNRSSARTPRGDEGPDDSTSRAPGPQLARLLRDGKGKFMYIGDSANLSFLQNIRRLVKSSIGDCSLTTDPLRHALVEGVPTKRPSFRMGHNGSFDVKPSLEQAKELVRQYLVATSGVLDLFDPADFMEHLAAWVNESTRETDFTSSIYYLVCAIGAQVQPRTDDEGVGEDYFNRGRQLVTSNFMDDPSVFTIQSYALITAYMMTMCRGNEAFMNLGIAVRAAYALGLHRGDISALFEARERRTRERVWKSLRVLDVCLSASLGRPPATSEVDGGHASWTRLSRDYEDIHLEGLNLSATLRLCFIFERILNDVYCRREVSAHLVESISQQYREWTMEFPGSLKFDGLEQGDRSTYSMMHHRIGVVHLKAAYYWSIVLLTRPFLVFKVSYHLKQKRKERIPEDHDLHSPTQTFADACVDSAVRSLDAIYELLQLPNLPKKLALLINSAFTSAMVFGVACFGDFDMTFPLNRGLDQAVVILGSFAQHDPLARRYLQITRYLHEAAAEHVRRRDLEQMQQRRQDVSHIFGNIIAENVSTQNKQDAGPAPLTPTSQQIAEKHSLPEIVPNGGVDDLLYFQRSPDPQANNLFAQGPTLTTSGALAAPAQPGTQPDTQSDTQPDTQQAYDAGDALGRLPHYSSPQSPGIPSNQSLTDEFPLFSVLEVFDPMMPEQFLPV